MTATMVKDVTAAEAVMQRTPRANRDLAQKLGGFATIAEALDYAAQGVTGFNFYSGRGVLQTVLPYADLRQRALATARKLLSAGVKRGERVAVVAETGPDFMAVFFGCQYAGMVPCPMPYSMYIGGRDAYVERVAGMLKAARANAVITSEELAEQIGAGAALAGVSRVMTHGALQAQPESMMRLEGFAADDVAYIQYSSGSTSDPKGVLVTQKSITTNCAGILRHGLKVTPADRAFSWLPLYHDMGLVGFCLSPLMGQVTVDYMATTAFARRPALWLKLMSDNRTTCAFSPTFGYELAARRVNGDAGSLDLSAWRVAGIGGDMGRAGAPAEFSPTAAAAGFKATAFMPSYGMAESTLAVSFVDVGSDLKVDRIDRAAMKTFHHAVPARPGQAEGELRSFVVCGKPLPGHELVVRGEDGKALPERRIGRIFVSGPSLMAGYYQKPEATAAVLGEDGFLDTGDMGYMLKGEIVITGRAKDLILHNGRNIWPQDIEWAAERVDGVRSGDVAAFAVEAASGEDEVVVLVECRLGDAAAREALRREVGAVVHESAGVQCQIVLVPPKSLPFTSSGKLSRAGARQKYLDGEIAEMPLPAMVAAQ